MVAEPVHGAARRALAETGVEAKLAAVDALWSGWCAGTLAAMAWSDPEPLVEAGIPERPLLAPAHAMPRRELSHPEGHPALIHALAHIEFTAINLALDAVYRFPCLPPAFHDDWLRVAVEEARHFRMLRDHLRGLRREYGDFPAHGGLWDLARKTAHDPLLRMALVPRLMEARGLDATPGIRRKLAAFGDTTGAAILDVVLADEVGHVAVGDRWFRHLCQERGLAPEPTYLELVTTADVPSPRPPFNEAARLRAGFTRAELSSLAQAWTTASRASRMSNRSSEDSPR